MSTSPLWLDYVAEPPRSRWAGAALLVAALVAAMQLLAHYRQIHRELATIELRQDLLDSNRRPERRVSHERLAEQSERANAVLRRLTVPWTRMIETVEAASMPQVVLLQIQPEPEHRTLRLSAEAQTTEAMLGYTRRLAESRFFVQVYLVSHQVQEAKPGHPIQFVVQASFGGAT